MLAEDDSRHVERVFETIGADGAARSALAASWRRSSLLHKLDPAANRPPNRMTEGEFRAVIDACGSVIDCAQPVLDRLHDAVGGVGCCVMLASADGVPVDRRGSRGDDDTFEGWGLWTGTVWSERCEGTNGIGTAIAEQRPVTIHRDQHFFARNTGLSCSSAPIHDHLGRLAAVLDVSSCRADLTEGFLALIMQTVGDAARRIEAEVFRRGYPKARILLAPLAEPRVDGLIAVDRDDLVVGMTRAARLALGLSPNATARPFPVADLGTAAGDGREDLAEAERGAVQRALARAGGNVSAAAASLGISRATLHRKINKLAIREPNPDASID